MPFFIIIILFATITLHTQEIELNPIVVLGNKNYLEEKKDIDTAILKKNIHKNFANLLLYNTNLNIRLYGANGLATLSVRGTSASHSQIYWNETPLNSSMNGQTDLSVLPVFIFEKVTIANGLNSLFFNTGSLGGSLITKTNYFKKNFIDIQHHVNSFYNFCNIIQTNFVLDTNKTLKIKLLNNIGQNNYKYINYNLPEKKISVATNAQFDQKSYLWELFYNLNNNFKIKLSNLFVYNLKNFEPSPTFEGIYRQEYQKTKYLIFVTNIQKNQSIYSYLCNISFIRSDLQYYLADSIKFFPKNKLFIKNFSLNKEFSIYLKNTIKVDFSKIFFDFSIKNSFNVGKNINILTNNAFQATLLTNELTSIISQKIFKTCRQALIISIIQRAKKIYPALSYHFLLHQKRYSLWFNIGKNIHLPTINDLYWQPGGNPNLLPEKSFNFEFGKEYQNKRLKINNTFFAMYVKDWIMWKPTELSYWMAENIKKVLVYGAETNINLKSNLVTFATLFSYNRAINLTKSNVDDASYKKQLIYTPKIKVSSNLIINYKKKEIILNLIYTSKSFSTTDNDPNKVIKDFLVANLLISKTINVGKNLFNLNFEISNIFNKNYELILYKPMPLRNYTFTLKIMLQ